VETFYIYSEGCIACAGELTEQPESQTARAKQSGYRGATLPVEPDGCAEVRF